MSRDVKAELIRRISQSCPDFDEYGSKFEIEVYGEFGGFSEIHAITVWDSDDNELDGAIDTDDAFIDLLIEVIDAAGALEWGSYETAITLRYEDGLIEVQTKATDEIFGEL